MAQSTVLWIDLRVSASGANPAGDVASRYHLERVACCDDIASAIARHQPGILCFDFDIPGVGGMAALQATKSSYPCLPIIMLTERHSEALALWALRVRVWNYLVKPVAFAEIERTFEQLMKIDRSERSFEPHTPVQDAATSTPYSWRLLGTPLSKFRTRNS